MCNAMLMYLCTKQGELRTCSVLCYSCNFLPPLSLSSFLPPSLSLTGFKSREDSEAGALSGAACSPKAASPEPCTPGPGEASPKKILLDLEENSKCSSTSTPTTCQGSQTFDNRKHIMDDLWRCYNFCTCPLYHSLSPLYLPPLHLPLPPPVCPLKKWKEKIEKKMKGKKYCPAQICVGFVAATLCVI